MTRKTLWAACILTIYVCGSPAGNWPTKAGDEPVKAAPSRSVALIDLTRIFNSHARFKKLSDALRKDVEAAERAFNARNATLQAANAALAMLPAGSAEAVTLKAQVDKETATLQADVQIQKKDFFEQESAIYLEIYHEITKEVTRYAEARSIKLVMRFNSEKPNPNDPQSIQKELNKAVLYQKGLDISDQILQIVSPQPEA
jgi:Skp family chaperone for outer membrane proteins